MRPDPLPRGLTPLRMHHPCGLALDERGLSVNTIDLCLVRTKVPRGMRRHVLHSCSVPLPVRSCVAWPKRSCLGGAHGLFPSQVWSCLRVARCFHRAAPTCHCSRSCPPGDFCRGSPWPILTLPTCRERRPGTARVLASGFSPRGQVRGPLSSLRRRWITVLPWALPLSGFQPPVGTPLDGSDSPAISRPPAPAFPLPGAIRGSSSVRSAFVVECQLTT
jgi:hypothetical protein